MEQDLNSNIEQFMQCLKDSYEMTVRYNPTPEEILGQTEYLETMAALCSLKDDTRKMESAKAHAIERRATGNLEVVFKEELEKLQQKTYHAKKSKEYKEFQAFVQSCPAASGSSQQQASTKRRSGRKSGIADDELVLEGTVNVYDPLSKLRMQNPVRNTLCGHHYEKTTILEAIKVNKKLRCPVAGCGNEQPIAPTHLLDDNEFKLRLRDMPETE